MKYRNILVLVLFVTAIQDTQRCTPAHSAQADPSRSTAENVEHGARLIFDTDMGNDIDDALALGIIHALQDRGECTLLAVTLSKDNAYSAAFVDLVNTFYGRGDIPVGVVRNGKMPEDGKYIRPVAEAAEDGKQRYPHDLLSGSVRQTGGPQLDCVGPS